MAQEIKYDSTADTLRHIKRVNYYLGKAACELIKRGARHDDSKLSEPEKALFDELTPRLAGLTYNSPEYIASLQELDVALQHHYANNAHHPQHYPNGINDMNLFDVMEMFFDWKAASERHNNGNIRNSITANQERFAMDDQLSKIFNNTVNYLGW